MRNTISTLKRVFCTYAASVLIGFWTVLAPQAHSQSQNLPLFDAHLHYNVEAWDYMPVDKVFALFKENNVRGILANSRPNEGSWKLLANKQTSVQIVPFVRVYRDRDDYGVWFQKPEVYAHIVAELDREPRAKGIGEFHLNGDQGAHPGVKKIVDLAQARGLWLHAHADEESLRHILKIAPNAKVVWAHTGFGLALENVAAILQAHPNVVGELSYRSGLHNGGLSAGWRELFIRFPNQFVIGSDTWINQRWEMYAQTMAGYRSWLALLPPDVARKIAYENGERMFGVK